MKKVLILGAGGFIGSHLTEAIAKHPDFDLIAIDITKEKLDDIKVNFQYQTLDLTKNRKELSDLIHQHDIIVNLIAIANPGIYVKDPLSTFRLDFTENLWIVEECVKAKKRLIHFSSSEVYGKSPSHFNEDKVYEFDEDESHFILGPVNKHRWIYSSSKQLLERVIHAYGIQEDFQYTIIRPFNYIGPKIDFLPSHEVGIPRVFSFFMDALMYKKPLYLVNGGEQKRCYTDIRDATVAHIKIIENEEGKANQEIINIGHRGNETSIKALAEKMCEIWHAKTGNPIPELLTMDGEEFYGKGYDDSDRRIPVSKKIEAMGWYPEYKLDQILEHTMNYYMEKYEV